ncbi:MAG: hypothetical protein K2J85_01235 [Anaeroplasmataceae bacterium]|nr:hypothetical protein [Anaeroplasmataceae bacterium]
MKKHSKLFLLCSAGLLALSVASCGNKKANRNTSVPLASMNPSTVIATSGNFEIQNDLFYTRLLYTGYNKFLN